MSVPYPMSVTSRLSVPYRVAGEGLWTGSLDEQVRRTAADTRQAGRELPAYVRRSGRGRATSGTRWDVGLVLLGDGKREG